MTSEQVIPAHIEVTKHFIQVNAPGYPVGATLTGAIMSTSQHWERKGLFRRKWVMSPISEYREVTFQLSASEVEKMIFDWDTDWDDFDEWKAHIYIMTQQRLERQRVEEEQNEEDRYVDDLTKARAQITFLETLLESFLVAEEEE